MCENLGKVPRKSILKQSSSFDSRSSNPQEQGPGNEISAKDSSTSTSSLTGTSSTKAAKFDEMNIMQTYHPTDKDYGYVQIDEPKTPFNFLSPSAVEDDDLLEGPLNEEELQRRLLWLEERRMRRSSRSESISEEREEDGERLKEDESDTANLGEGGSPESEGSSATGEDGTKKVFKNKRTQHYNEYYAIKLARKLMEEEEDDDEVEGAAEGAGSSSSQAEASIAEPSS